MIVPKKLEVDAHIRIISTARKIEKSPIIMATNYLKKNGFIVSWGENLFSEDHQFAGKTEERVADLQDALDDPDINMIWLARGGYGTVSLLDYLNFEKYLKSPKWVVGYSDITGLLCHLNTLGVATIHGMMPVNFASDHNPKSLESLFNLLSGSSLRYALHKHPLNNEGSCSGELIGGNLSIIYSILGSKSSPNTDDKILFIEDLDEYLYHIDRMMLNLSRNGLLKNLRGMVVGGMTGMHDNQTPFGKTAEEIISSYVSDYNFPVYFGFDAGHTTLNQALPFGVDVTISNSQLIIPAL